MELNIIDFIKKFNEHYEFFYNVHDDVEGYRKLVRTGDNIISCDKFRDLIGKFHHARHDIMTSDREVAAFVLTMSDFGINYNNVLSA